MTNIPTIKLPIGVQQYGDFVIDMGGEFNLKEENIIKKVQEDDIIVECTYFENDTELNWFSNEGIMYIFVNGVNVCYFEHSLLHFI
jgi:hypothetical protein